jgi:hypothetical protein
MSKQNLNEPISGNESSIIFTDANVKSLVEDVIQSSKSRAYLKEVILETVDIKHLIEKIDFGYTSQKYEIFEAAVEKIIKKAIDGAERHNIKAIGKEAAKDYFESSKHENFKFWFPILISLLGIIISTVISLYNNKP